jgi:hypothetical protein
VAIAALAIPAILVLPWVADNLHRYGALTAASVMKRMQGPFLNPGDKPFGLVRLAQNDKFLLNGVLPEEWANTALIIYQTPSANGRANGSTWGHCRAADSLSP